MCFFALSISIRVHTLMSYDQTIPSVDVWVVCAKPMSLSLEKKKRKKLPTPTNPPRALTQAKASTTTGQNNIAHYTLVLRGHLGCVILQSFGKEIQKKNVFKYKG